MNGPPVGSSLAAAARRSSLQETRPGNPTLAVRTRCRVSLCVTLRVRAWPRSKHERLAVMGCQSVVYPKSSSVISRRKSGFSTERVGGPHAWSQMHGRPCAGGAVLKKIAARFSFRGLRARKDTIAHATESHGVIRATVAVARRTGTQRACVVRAVRERVTSLLRRACSLRGCSRAAARKQEAPPNLG